MKIIGQKHLNSGLYDSITITNTIKAISNLNYKTLNNNSKSYCDTLKEFESEKQLDSILDYYLRGNKLDFITDNYKHSGQNYIMLDGTRSFKTNKPLSKKQIEKILIKYNKDRIEYLLNSDHEIIEFNTNKHVSSYYEYTNMNDFEERFLITLFMNENYNMPEFEIDFLETYLTHLFGENKVEVYEEYDYYLYWKTFKGLYITGTDKKIIINRALLPKIDWIIYKHNKKIDEKYSHIKQLKMEGF